VIKELTTYLAANVAGTPALVVGTNLFAVWRPEGKADRSTLIQERSPGRDYDDGSKLIEKPLQISSRSLDAFQARDDALRIHDYLINKAGISIGGGWTLQSITGGEPFYVGTDSHDRHIYTFNLVMVCKK
jgi:hypothetical protein